MTDELIDIEVAYARPDKQRIIPLKVKPGTTALEAVKASGIVAMFPEIEPESAKMGIFANVLGTKGFAAADEYQLQPKDRIEIYRPLIADPKEVRKRRAEQKKAAIT